MSGAVGKRNACQILERSNHEHHQALENFFLALALCHKVQAEVPEEGKGEIHYSGMSPDEVSLVKAAHDMGITFKERVRAGGSVSSLVVGPSGYGTRSFDLLHDIEFNSDRKRMSVIVRQNDGVLFLYTKGADNIMMGLLDKPLSKETQEHLGHFSRIGLRTLVIARRQIPLQEYNQWESKLSAAKRILDATKDEEVAKVEASLEVKLTFLGVTAVEDRLQDGVPETLEALKAAGIHVWVLTGDKTETAVDIARSSNLFNSSTTLVYATQARDTAHVQELLLAAREGLKNSDDGGLVLDGQTVRHILEDRECGKLTYKLGLACRSCICCRLSPIQKRLLVELVRKGDSDTVTLAIGDGANDVPMIDGAHLGIGLRGKEGNQAVQASDIAISQFRFLQPLLFCHGRRAYRRVAFFICFYYYKNMVLAAASTVWVHIGRMTFDLGFPEYLTAGYNMVFTSMHVIVMLGWDEDLPDSVSIAHPDLYLVGPQGQLFNAAIFAKWMMYSVWHGLVCWMVPYWWLDVSTGDYDVDDPSSVFWLSSCTSFFACVVVVLMRSFVFSMNFCKASTCLPVLAAVASYFPWAIILGYTSFGNNLQPNVEEVPLKTFSDPDALVCIPIAVGIALTPDVLERFFEHFFFPSEITKVRTRRRQRLPTVKKT